MFNRILRLLVILLVAAVMVGGGIWGYSRLATPRQVAPAGETVEVRRGNLVVTINASGSLYFPKKSRLSFPVAGTVVELAVQVGDEVKEGQVLARLDDAPFRKALLHAEASLKSAELALKKVESPYDAEALRRAEEAVASAMASLSLAEQDLTIAKARAARNLAAAQKPLDKAIEAYRQQMWSYYRYELTDEEIYIHPEVLIPQVLAGRGVVVVEFKAPKPVLDAYEAVMDAKASYDFVVLQEERSLAAAQISLERARESLRKAEADLAKIKAGADPEEVALKRLHLTLAQIALTEAQRDLEGTVLKSPFAGVVSEVKPEVGSRVGAGVVVITIVDTSKVEVEASVDEVDVAQVRVGQMAMITLDAFPGRIIPGRVKSISLVGQVQAGVVSYPIVVEIVMAGAARPERPRPPDERAFPFREGMPFFERSIPPEGIATLQLREGMTALAAIVVEQRSDVLLVPARAVRTIGGKKIVEVVTPAGIVEREITTGLSDGFNIEVVSGLEEGERVLVRARAAAPTPGLPFGQGRGFPGMPFFR